MLGGERKKKGKNPARILLEERKSPQDEDKGEEVSKLRKLWGCRKGEGLYLSGEG